MLNKIILFIKWIVETFKVAISIVLVIILLLALTGCTNLESLVTKNTTDNSVKENTLLKIGDNEKWHIVKAEERKEVITISAKVGGLGITTALVAE